MFTARVAHRTNAETKSLPYEGNTRDLITVMCEKCSCASVLRHTRTPSNRHLDRVAAWDVIVRRIEGRQDDVLCAPETHREATDQTILADAGCCDTPVLHTTCWHGETRCKTHVIMKARTSTHARGTTTCNLQTDYVHIMTGATLDCDDDIAHTKPWCATACLCARDHDMCKFTVH